MEMDQFRNLVQKIHRQKLKMEMKFHTSTSNINKELFNTFLKDHENSNVFQSFEMFDFWKSKKNNDPFLFFVESDNGDCLAFCTGVIMSNGISLMKTFTSRAIIFGGPIVIDSENKQDILRFLTLKMSDYLRKKSIYIEVRNFYKDSYIKDVFQHNNWNYKPYQNYIIHLISEDDVFSNIKAEKRRQIRKALREGVEIDYEKSNDNIEGVYNVLLKIYKERVKKPLPNLNFFTSLMMTDSAGLTCIKFENKIIGGGFFLKDENTIYDWYRGGLDFEYKKQFPATMAAWAVIKYGLDNHLKKFDFMGAGLKGEEYGVRKFKSQFGGELVEYGRFLKINNKTVYNIAEKSLKILSR